jgi:hypothetical protein
MSRSTPNAHQGETDVRPRSEALGSGSAPWTHYSRVVGARRRPCAFGAREVARMYAMFRVFRI